MIFTARSSRALLSSHLFRFLLAPSALLQVLIISTADHQRQDDLAVSRIRSRIVPAPSESLRRKLNRLRNPNGTFYGDRQDELMDHVLGRFLQRDAGRGPPRPFVVEAGAGDGERLSNSLFFERVRGFDCLLVEPSGEQVRNEILPRRRNCAVLEAALWGRRASGEGAGGTSTMRSEHQHRGNEERVGGGETGSLARVLLEDDAPLRQNDDNTAMRVGML